MPKYMPVEEFTRKYGKPDVERLGIFIEMPYISAKGNMAKTTKKPETLRNMLAGFPKTKCGNMDGYFDDEFRRIFKGERGKKSTDKGTSLKVPFIPCGPSKKHGCPGDYFGTFGGHIKAFSRQERPKPKYQTEKPNPVTNPGKKGGPGYVNITIGKYPEHKSERAKKLKENKAGMKPTPMRTMHWPQPYFEPNPYRDPKKDPPTKRLYIRPAEPALDKKLAGRPLFIPTGPNKWIGGCKAGCFSKWPEWKMDKYLSPAQIEKFSKANKNKTFVSTGTKFGPQSMAMKTMFTTSVLYNTNFSMNAQNWKTYEPTYVKYLL